MEPEAANIRDRVRDNTPQETNMKIDQKSVNRIFKYRNLTADERSEKLKKLSREWDIERALEVNASALALAGLVLGATKGRGWLILPAVVTGFLFQHGIQGWCPPVSLFRYLGLRTRQEIEEEVYAIKAMRGDFDNLNQAAGPIEILSKFRR